GRKLSQHWQEPLCAVAAALGLWLAFKLVDALAPMPTLIAATRDASDMSAMLASAALAGWLFGRLTAGALDPRDRKTNPVLILMLASGLLWSDAEPRAQEHPDYRVETLAQGLEHPWSLAFLPEGGALVTERPGRLRRLNAEGQLEPEPLA